MCAPGSTVSAAVPHDLRMSIGPVTELLTVEFVDDHGRPRHGGFTDAQLRAGMLVDLAAAGLIVGREGVPRAVTGSSDFAPADTLLEFVARQAGISWLICRGAVGMPQVREALVASGVWVPRRQHSWFHHEYDVVRTVNPPRTRPAWAERAARFIGLTDDLSIDRDDLQQQVRAAGFDSAVAWVIAPIVDELIDLRLWRAATAVATRTAEG